MEEHLETPKLATEVTEQPVADLPDSALIVHIYPSSAVSGDSLPVLAVGPPESTELEPAIAPETSVDESVTLEETVVTTVVPPTSSRRLAESLILFVLAILFLRAMAVEPFGVPTGSMAPTLIGNHRLATCPRCGYVIRVGESPRPTSHYPNVTCPNCGKHNIDIDHAPDVSGDRLLVDKNVYSLRSPKRWELAVFRCPSDMSKPYVKRVLGLPGERIRVSEGDIYISDRLARKNLRECRESRIPIFDLNFPPRIDGWNKWLVVEKGQEATVKNESAITLTNRELAIDASAQINNPVWISYRHQHFDDDARTESDDVIRDEFIYNGAGLDDRLQPVHDFMVEFELEIVEGSGTLSCGMWDGHDQLIATCAVSSGPGAVELHQDGFGIVRSANVEHFEIGKKYRIEMAFIDRRVSFAIDGKEAILAYDLDPVASRADIISPLVLGVQGMKIVIRDMKLYRDIYYRSSGRNAIEGSYQLNQNEYFMLGDNSANSDDSRFWPIPGVPERNFLGKPFLLHQPSRLGHLSIGNQVRTFHSIDWGRIRFLR